MPTATPRRELPRATVVALGVAVVAAVGLLVIAFVAPLYTATSSGGSGSSTGTATLVQVNGVGVLIPLGLPLLLSLGAAASLWADRSWSRNLAWALTAATLFLTILSLASVGLFMLPVATALVVACLSHARAR